MRTRHYAIAMCLFFLPVFMGADPPRYNILGLGANVGGAKAHVAPNERRTQECERASDPTPIPKVQRPRRTEETAEPETAELIGLTEEEFHSLQEQLKALKAAAVSAPPPEPERIIPRQIVVGSDGRRLYFFGATWCRAPCANMKASVTKFAKDNGLSFGEHLDGKPDDIEHANIDDPKVKVVIDVPAVPLVVVVDRTGREFGRIDGFTAATVNNDLMDLWTRPIPPITERVEVPKSAPAKASAPKTTIKTPSNAGASLAPRYTWPGNPHRSNGSRAIAILREHVRGGEHHIDPSTMSADELIAYHDNWHDVYGERDTGPESPAVGSGASNGGPVRNFFSRPFQSGNCPNGRCPVRRRR